LGLQFAGMDQEAIATGVGRSEWWADPDAKGVIYTDLGFTALPIVDRASQPDRCLFYNPGKCNSPAEWLRGLKGAIENSTLQPSCLCAVVPGGLFRALSPFLCDRHGNYVDNTFYRQLALTQTSRHESFRADVVFHLRLGDVANIDDIVENAVLVPWRFLYHGELFSGIERERIRDSARYDKLEEFADAARRLRASFPGIRIGVVTDGYDYSYTYLTKDRAAQRLRMLGVEIDNIDLNEKKLKHKEIFFEKFRDVDFIIYGESDDRFSQTISALISAPLVVSSSGIFASTIVNNFGTQHQTVFLFHREREHPARRGVRFDYVTLLDLSKRIVDVTKKTVYLLHDSTSS
jgi:hypothetical protein